LRTNSSSYLVTQLTRTQTYTLSLHDALPIWTGPDAPAGYGRMLRLPKEEAPHSRGAPRSDSSYLVTGPERAVPARDAYTSSGEQCLRDHARQRRCDLARALFARLPRHYTVP